MLGSLDAIYVEGRDVWCPLYWDSGVNNDFIDKLIDLRQFYTLQLRR